MLRNCKRQLTYFEVTEPKLRLGGSRASVRILGMIDRVQPKVNLMNINII